MFGMKPRIPTLAPWVQALATELASTNAEYLSLLMDLDRFIANLGPADQVEDAALERVRVLEDAVRTHKAGQDVAGMFAAEADLRKAEDTAKLATFSVDVDFQNAKRTLSVLQDGLRLEEDTLAAGLRTHLPWAKRRPVVRG